MINAYHLSDAIPAALFGMFALWAASSKRHWFVRTAIVAGALLVTLLIPAFEVVVEFGIECLFVVAGLAVWRRRRQAASPSNDVPSMPSGVRLSLESLMLTVTIVAVATAVASRAPRLSFDEWYRLLITGVVAAAVGLACVWIVCGQVRWWIRLVAAPLLAVVLATAHVVLSWTGNILNYWLVIKAPKLDEYFQQALRDFWPGITYWTTVVALGMAVLCVWLFLMRRAGWFDPFDELDIRPPTSAVTLRRVLFARFGTLLCFGLVSVFPLALLYRLLTPTPIPVVVLPDPNGYDDFVAAGRMFSSTDAAQLTAWNQLSDKTLSALLSQYTAAFDRARLGLQKTCSHPGPYKPSTQPYELSLLHLLFAMGARADLADRTGSIDERISAWWEMLRVSIEGDRGVGAAYSMPAQCESGATLGLWNCRSQFTSQQCADLAAKLWALESSREAWPVRAERQRIIDENANWQFHLQSILAGWSGQDRHVWERQFYLRRRTEVRTLILELAIRAYQMDLGSLPTNLSELVPKYLPAVPDDPYASGSMKYQVANSSYLIYSIGPDGKDDGGKRIIGTNGIEDGDYSAAELFPQPISSQPPVNNSQSAFK